MFPSWHRGHRRNERQRASALRFGDPRVQTLLAALLRFDLLPAGFRNRELRETVAPLRGMSLDDYNAGQMTYDLRRQRLRGLIERIPHSQRYRLTAEGLCIALAYHRTQARVLGPVLSATLDGKSTTRLQAANRRVRSRGRPPVGRTSAGRVIRRTKLPADRADRPIFPAFIREYGTRKADRPRDKAGLVRLLRNTHAEGVRQLRATGEVGMLQTIRRFYAAPWTRLAWPQHGRPGRSTAGLTAARHRPRGVPPGPARALRAAAGEDAGADPVDRGRRVGSPAPRPRHCSRPTPPLSWYDGAPLELGN